MQQIAAMKQAEGVPPVFSSLKRTRYDTDGSLLHCMPSHSYQIISLETKSKKTRKQKTI